MHYDDGGKMEYSAYVWNSVKHKKENENKNLACSEVSKRICAHHSFRKSVYLRHE